MISSKFLILFQWRFTSPLQWEQELYSVLFTGKVSSLECSLLISLDDCAPLSRFCLNTRFLRSFASLSFTSHSLYHAADSCCTSWTIISPFLWLVRLMSFLISFIIIAFNFPSLPQAVSRFRRTVPVMYILEEKLDRHWRWHWPLQTRRIFAEWCFRHWRTWALVLLCLKFSQSLLSFVQYLYTYTMGYSMACQSTSRISPWRKLGEADTFAENDFECHSKRTNFGWRRYPYHTVWSWGHS